MNFADILDRLEGVKRTGNDRAVAKCPAHNDRSPSLSIRETEDGTILVKCFAGCGAADVVAAIGMELSDLFPEKPTHHARPKRPGHWHAAREALRVLHGEVLIVAFAALDISKGKRLTIQDADRVVVAASKIREARELCR